MTLSEKPWRVKNWAGASKQKLLHGMGLPCKILFVGGSPKPGACRVYPTKWGCMLSELGGGGGGGQQTKSCSSGWVCILKFYLWGAHPNPKPAGSLDQSKLDYFIMKLWHSPGQRWVAYACCQIKLSLNFIHFALWLELLVFLSSDFWQK